MPDFITLDGIKVGYCEVVRGDIKNTYLKFNEDTLLLVSRRKLRDPKELILWHKSWITRHYLQVSEKMRFFSQGAILYRGSRFNVERQFYAGRPSVSIREEDSSIIIKAQDDRSAHAALVRHIKKLSLEHSRAVANLKADMIGVKISDVKVRKTKRWGACNSKKVLSFNSNIIMLPVALSDYVISHEVAHIKELNHSRRFWRVVVQMQPEYRALRKELQKYDNSERYVFNKMDGYPDIGHI